MLRRDFINYKIKLYTMQYHVIKDKYMKLQKEIEEYKFKPLTQKSLEFLQGLVNQFLLDNNLNIIVDVLIYTPKFETVSNADEIIFLGRTILDDIVWNSIIK